MLVQHNNELQMRLLRRPRILDAGLPLSAASVFNNAALWKSGYDIYRSLLYVFVNKSPRTPE